MTSTVDCSYTDSNGTRQQLTCSRDNAYCCANGDVYFCSRTTCTTVSASDSLSTYAFWLILAGVAVLGVILLVVIYLICRYRNPGAGFLHRKSIFGGTISESGQSRPGSRRPSTRINMPVFNTQMDRPRNSPRTTITVNSVSNGSPRTGSRPSSRWTILNGVSDRHPTDDRTDSREEIIKSRNILPDVQD